MISTARAALSRMKAWRAFRLAMKKIHDGIPKAQVLKLLGAPDLVGDADPEAGIDFSWEYHERLPDHLDYVVAFSAGAVCYSWTRDVPDTRRRNEFRRFGCPYSPWTGSSNRVAGRISQE
jgi:hypothetical protein